TGNLGATPKAAVIGFDNTVQALLFAPNGTIWLKSGTVATGTLIGKDVLVGEGVSFTKNVSGTCGPTDDGNPCTADSCDTATGTVHHDPVPAGTACDDATVCNGHESCDGAGTCQAGTPIAVDDGNECTADSCDSQTGAQHAPLTGTACNDDSACTQTDTCQAGTCTGTNPVSCAPLDQCHDAGTCNPTTGACTNPAKPDGTACNDESACTQTDTCQAGTCTGTNPVSCAPLDQCHDAGICNPTTGACTNPAKADGASCDDEDPCTTGEACSAGSCGGGSPTPVSDGNPCTADACSPMGGVTHTPVTAGTACSDADLCNGDELCNASGTCQPGTPVATSDGNPCTLDQCDPFTGSVTHPAAPAGTPCNADACTIGALCDAGGACQGGTPVLVDDGDPCTVDTCDPIGGPVHSECPELDSTVVSSVSNSTAWLYSGQNPIQTGVVPGAIDSERASVLFGRVKDRTGAPVVGVNVEVLGHAELGKTSTDATGRFYLVVNGGGRVVVDYSKAGFLPAQRGVAATWQEYVPVPDVVLVAPAAPMTSPSGAVTTLVLGAPAAQALVGPTETDQDGSRRAVLIAPAGLAATINGVPAPAALTLRATEYSVGSAGPGAMPAELPPNSAYTYAVELTADEAAGARLDFDQPVAFYVDGFLPGFVPGMTVPVGSYDRGRGLWVPEDSGLVVKIVSETAGLADLDTGGVPLPISSEERAVLAQLYEPPKLVWRFTTRHFSTWDCNWPFGPPPDAEPSPGPDPDPDDPLRDPCEKTGSVIECQNQTLGERIPIAGTPFWLHYRSDRVPGRAAARRLVVPIHQGTLPASLERIEVRLTVSGKEYSATIDKADALAHPSVTFDWDGTNLFGQRTQGRQPASVDIGYVYKGWYGDTRRFAENATAPITLSRTRQEVTLHRVWHGQLGTPWDARAQGLGGWSLSSQHVYDPQAGTVFFGDGARSELGAATVQPVAGTAAFNPLSSFALGPDGAYYLGTFAAVWQVPRSGTATRVAGTGNWGFGGDGGPATTALLGMTVADVAVAGDGSLYIADADNGRIRVVRGGLITTFAGGGTSTADGAPALQAQIQARSLALGADGAVYFAEPNANQVRKVGTDGRVVRVAGTGAITGPFGEGGPALAATVSQPSRVAVARDGTLYVAHRFDNNHYVVRSVSASGVIRTVAGKTTDPVPPFDGIPATQEVFRNALSGLEAGRDGSLYIAQYDNGFAGTVNLVRRVDPSGIITTVAGDRSKQATAYGEGPATRINIYQPVGVREEPGGTISFASNNQVRRLRGHAPPSGASPGELVVASADGRAMHVFDALGRHLRTDSAHTGATLLLVQYGPDGRLTGLTDGNGGLTQVVRNGLGSATAIVGPYGQVTALGSNADGYLSSVTSPAGEVHSMLYGSIAQSGLLKSLTDPRGATTWFSYDAVGRLSVDADPAGGSKTLGRVDLQTGWEVSHTTALGRTTTYRTERLPAGGQLRTQTFPDGTSSTLLRGNDDGVDSATLPDGTLAKASQALDPRFGLQSPVVSRTTRTPGGLVRTETRERTTSPLVPTTPYAVTAVTDSVTVNGRTTTTVFDKPTLTTTVTSPAGRATKTFHDPQMRVTRREVTGITPVDFVYDSRGRLATVTQGPRVRSTGYYSTGDGRNGYVQSVTNALSQTTAFTPDAVGRIQQQLDPDSALTSFGWDGNGNLTGVTPPGQPAHGQTFTPVDLLAAYTPPVVPGVPAPATLFTYNVDRQLTQTTRPDALLVGRTYDSAGKLDLLTTPTGNVDYDYFGLTPCPTCAPGRLQKITDPSGVVLEHGYDGMLLKTLTWSGAVAGSVSFGHDSSFRVTSETVAVGATTSPVAFGYDNDDILICASPSTCSPAGTDALKLTLNAGNGLVTGSTHGVVTDTLTYNAFGELASYAGKVGATGVLSEVVDTASNPRDALGRIVQRVETNGSAAITWRYAYDLRGRLTDVLKDGSAYEQYGYGGNGNRTLLTTPSGTTVGVYDAQDRLLSYGATTYTYTANGELRTKTDSGGTTTYTYDVRGNLVRVDLPGGDVIEYLVDGQDRRVGKKKNGVVERAWLYRNQLNPVAELDGAGNLVSRFAYGAKSNVPEYVVSGGVTYRLLSDHLGSPRALVDVATGVVAWRADFDAWGNRTLIAGAADFVPFGFAGGMLDPETGLTRFGARDYDPVVGRWSGKDARKYWRRGTNLYAYGDGEPVNRIDPAGKEAIAVGLGAGTVAGAAAGAAGTYLLGKRAYCYFRFRNCVDELNEMAAKKKPPPLPRDYPECGPPPVTMDDEEPLPVTDEEWNEGQCRACFEQCTSSTGFWGWPVWPNTCP
ncbi:MAG: hypothetical protein HYZ29_25980, partial [Myxococcales bacterium]|nr:hypothetical protein [Myxococcales bacterium]